MRALDHIYNNKIAWYILIILISIGIAAQNILLGENHFWGGVYTFYNNYVIFKTSFFNLIHHQNLYTYHLEKHADLFKYSPTFALFMGLFYYLPDWAGLSLWNILNASVLLFSITKLPGFSNKKQFYILLFIVIELVLNLQNCQTNALIAGLTILSFTSLEKNKPGLAAFFICCGFFIKIFILAACLMILFYPNKIRFILFLIFWSIIFFLLPSIITGIPYLIQLYKEWLHLIGNDRSGAIELYKAGDTYSIYRICDILKLTGSIKTIILLTGTILLIAPLLLIKKYKSFEFRLTYLAILLIWIVIFNHKAESPSYIISMAGIGTWCLMRKNSKLVMFLLFAALLFTSLFFTDLTPQFLRHNLDKALVKTSMSCLVFFVLLIDLYRIRQTDIDNNVN